jgi:hypothetical protein
MSMNSIFRLKKRGDAGKPVLAGFLAVCCLGMAVSANATINDPDYFNLYPTTLGPVGMKGEGESVSVCGVSGCDADFDMIVSTISITPAGSGVRDTFLRVQAPGNGVTETAYNTELYPLQEDSDYRNGAKDTNAGNKDTFNNAVLISDLLKVNANGEAWEDGDGLAYYQILLDVNENGSDSEFIRLDEFEVHTSNTGYVGEFGGFGGPTTADGTSSGTFGIDDPAGTGTGAARKVFDMDWWKTDAAVADGSTDPVNPNGGMILSSRQDGKSRNGSGDEDYSFLVPEALFNSDDVYLHVAATFGCEVVGSPNHSQCVEADTNDPHARTQAGFEEFAAVLGPNPEGGFDVPVPGTVLLFGLGLVLLRRKQHLVS